MNLNRKVLKYMRFPKIKKIYGIIRILIIILLIFLVLSACNKTQTTEIPPAETKKETEFDIEKIKQESIEAAALYKDLYLQAEKTKSEYFPYRSELSQTDIDDIENLLISKGFSVINSDSKYPEYLENADGFYDFWNSTILKEEAKFNVISVTSTGGLFYTSLQYLNDTNYRISVTIEWNDNNEPTVSSEEHGGILDWDLVNDTYFYYQIYVSGVSFDDYSLIRLKPVDKELYDLNAKYIKPIGYASNNMFVSEWNYKDYGNLSFNDLLEPFYKIQNNDYFDDDAYPKIREPYLHSYIPAALFESTIMPYFDISLQEFRERCLYNREKDAYPWQQVCCENITTYPVVESEVIKYQYNNDGTITITVNARCNDYKTPCLFTHEVVIRIISDNEYYYLSNKITYKGDYELPPNCPRLPPQRTVCNETEE